MLQDPLVCIHLCHVCLNFSYHFVKKHLKSEILPLGKQCGMLKKEKKKMG